MRMIATKRAVLVLALVLVCSACPSSNDLDRAAKASDELGRDLVIANKVVGEFYKAGKIPLADKDRIAKQLRVIGDKGETLNNILIELDKKYPQGTVPPQNAQFIRDNVSELRKLYTDVVASLLPFKAQKAVDKLGEHLNTIEEAAKK